MFFSFKNKIMSEAIEYKQKFESIKPLLKMRDMRID